MTRLSLLPLVALPLFTAPATADPPPASVPVVAHLEIASQHNSADHAISIAPDGDPGIIDAEGPRHSLTHVQLRLHTRGSSGISFEVRHVAEDKTTWSARGDVPLPAPGKKQVVAQIPHPTGPIELRLSLTPATP